MGSSEHVRRASYWKSQDAEDQQAIADAATASNAEPDVRPSCWLQV